uniref:CS domain-containing protein n=1 Tax=Noctiluca scintillans TaxID=2966 RepID=A0A7S1FKT3_NOCSC|mmetsp:Transcript_9447/g.26335  ORF Transcript_9447/g.26335 Transcript_9447/m.26335 type:complete len:163 (+) Transcript_9447:69-557(+)|eukprot:CAMPEP_0194502536 /NCGR_PEP_ID=MMETSP0253-20130528/26080_1 /TAXON_ID=2966 /ORGANISM="Noctiluca scintillans" /LENGTH=162 /DNA_ID=CAMNT_0039344697 /DNA_START=69 /DNA_END=557 /DNA_ORIENTATION=-
MVASTPLKPALLWAQRRDSVWVTVDIKESQGLSVQLTEDRLAFSAISAEDGTAYGFSLDFYAPISKEKSKWSSKRCPEFCLVKQSEETWPRLNKEGKLQWVKADWSKWADSDDEDEKGGFDTNELEGMDFADADDSDTDVDEDILADLDEEISILTDDEEKP